MVQETEELTGQKPKAAGQRRSRPPAMEAMFRRDRSWVLFLASALVAGIAFAALLLVQKNILNEYERGYVITTQTYIHAGTDLTEVNVQEWFAVTEIPLSLTPEGAYIYRPGEETEAAYLIRTISGMVAAVDLEKGEILVASNLENGPYPETAISEELVETSFSLQSIVQAVAGTLRRGDEFSIAVFDNEQFEDGTVMEHLIVKQAYASDGIALGVGEEGQAVLFTVLLTREQEATLNRLIAGGGTMRLSRTNHIQY